MFFAKIAAVATLALSAFAAPITTTSANPTDVLAVMNALKGEIAPALATLKDITSNGVEGITAEAVKPALDKVMSVLDNATGALHGLNVLPGVPEVKRDGAVGEVASVAAGVLGEVFTTLNGLKGVPVVGDLIPAVEASLSGLIGGLNSVLAGVLALLAPLLSPVLNIANGLGLGGLLGGLGL